MPLPTLALVRDLIFATRISTVARAARAEVKTIRNPAVLGNQPGRLLIVDLNLDGAIEAATQWKAGTNGPVVGFVSHVDAETAARARAAGIDRVMARSQFVKSLQELLVADSLP